MNVYSLLSAEFLCRTRGLAWAWARANISADSGGQGQLSPDVCDNTVTVTLRCVRIMFYVRCLGRFESGLSIVD